MDSLLTSDSALLLLDLKPFILSNFLLCVEHDKTVKELGEGRLCSLKFIGVWEEFIKDMIGWTDYIGWGLKKPGTAGGGGDV